MQELTKESIYECLKDIGLDDVVIQRCLQHYQKENLCEFMTLLKCERCELLKIVHREQERLDCLDYLIHNIKKSLRCKGE